MDIGDISTALLAVGSICNSCGIVILCRHFIRHEDEKGGVGTLGNAIAYHDRITSMSSMSCIVVDNREYRSGPIDVESIEEIRCDSRLDHRLLRPFEPTPLHVHFDRYGIGDSDGV